MSSLISGCIQMGTPENPGNDGGWRNFLRAIRFELVRRCGKWDKQNRSSLELCPTGVDLPRSEPEAELLPSETKIQLEENNPSGLQLLGV
jgi:hypothetical protein